MHLRVFFFICIQNKESKGNSDRSLTIDKVTNLRHLRNAQNTLLPITNFNQKSESYWTIAVISSQENF